MKQEIRKLIKYSRLSESDENYMHVSDVEEVINDCPWCDLGDTEKKGESMRKRLLKELYNK